jgi:putative Mn2+ efflux pump MntP
LNIWEQLLLVLGLSMDGFAAAVCMGMETRNRPGRGIFLITAMISGCHVVMLLLGYLLGTSCRGPIAKVYPWAAALLLTLLGVHMLREAGQSGPKEKPGSSLTSIAALSFATSIDATTVGVAFALYEVPAWQTVTLVALIMGSLSLLGAACGGHIGAKYRRGARIAGGIILCLLGVKLLASTLK